MFKRSTPNPNKVIKVKIISEYEHKTDSLMVSSGLYNFIVDEKKIKARFSFVFLRTMEGWKILSHHSSKLPKNEVQRRFSNPISSLIS